MNPLKRIALVLLLSLSMVHGALAASSQSVSASWTAPTTRMDGTPLAPTEISNYKLYYSVGSAPTADSKFVTVKDATTATLNLTLAPSPTAQTVYVAVTAVDMDGLESPMSAAASKSFIVKSTALPTAPTSLTFTISCGDGCSITAE